MLLKVKLASRLAKGDHVVDAENGTITRQVIINIEQRTDGLHLTTDYGREYDVKPDEMVVIAK